MRSVALFIPHLGVGGAELQLCLLASRLRGVGWEPFVATLEDLHGIAPRLTEAGVDVVILPRSGRVGIDGIAALAREVRRRGAGVVHAWLWAANWRAVAARAAAPRTRVVASIRSMEDDLDARHAIAYRTLSPLIDAIVVNSQAILDHSSERTGIPREKYRLVRNGVVLPPSTRGVQEPPTVGYVGTLHPRKRALSLAPLAAQIVRRVPSVRFLVVGDGPDRTALEAACTALGIRDRFELVGYAPHVEPYLRRMSVLMHPSANEGSSNSILEAMAAGIPVVAYAVSGNRETVTHGTTGFLAEDGNEDELASAVADLLLRPEEARQFGAAGRARIESEFSVEGMVRGTAAIYEDVVRGR